MCVMCVCVCWCVCVCVCVCVLVCWCVMCVCVCTRPPYSNVVGSLIDMAKCDKTSTQQLWARLDTQVRSTSLSLSLPPSLPPSLSLSLSFCLSLAAMHAPSPFLSLSFYIVISFTIRPRMHAGALASSCVSLSHSLSVHACTRAL